MNILDFILENPAIKAKLDFMSKTVKESYLEKLSDISIFLSASNKDVEDIDYEKALNNPDSFKADDYTDSIFILNTLIGNLSKIDEFQKVADNDENGDLTEEELKAYLSQMMGNDGDDKNLTLKDFDKLLEELEISAVELFQDDFDNLFEDKINDFFESEENIDDINGPNDQYSQAFFEENGDSSVNLAMGNPKGTPTRPQNNLDRMTIEQLKSEEEKQNTAVEEKKEAINAIHNGENPRIKAALEEELTAKEEYEKALDEDSSPEIKELKEELKENDKNIQTNEAEVNNAKIDVNNKEVEVSNQETTVNNAKNELTSLQSSLNSLPAPTGKPEDAERDAQIAQQKASIEQQIQAKEAQIQKEEETLNNLKTNLQTAKDNLASLEETQTQLEATRTQLEDNIALVATETTKEALSNYQSARDNVQEIKTTELSSAQKALETEQASLKNITDKINEKEISKTKRENSINMGDDVAEFAMSLKGLSEEQMQSYMWKNYNEGKEWKDQCPFNKGGYCADFVYFAWRMTVGDEGLPDWYRNCENFSYPANIDRKARAAGALRDFSTKESLINTVKPGDLITYGNHVEGEGGHIGMIAEVRDDGTIITIEGNTVPYGSVNSHEIKYEDLARKNVHQIISMDS